MSLHIISLWAMHYTITLYHTHTSTLVCVHKCGCGVFVNMSTHVLMHIHICAICIHRYVPLSSTCIFMCTPYTHTYSICAVIECHKWTASLGIISRLTSTLTIHVALRSNLRTTTRQLVAVLSLFHTAGCSSKGRPISFNYTYIKVMPHPSQS